jgi:hypothetical protein
MFSDCFDFLSCRILLSVSSTKSGSTHIKRGSSPSLSAESCTYTSTSFDIDIDVDLLTYVFVKVLRAFSLKGPSEWCLERGFVSMHIMGGSYNP